jgi:hypothetical protein
MADRQLILMLNAIRMEIRAGHLVDLIGAYSDRADKSEFEGLITKLEELHKRSDTDAMDAFKRGREPSVRQVKKA